jgi:outer membrane receptor protein involved in Fe transport
LKKRFVLLFIAFPGLMPVSFAQAVGSISGNITDGTKPISFVAITLAPKTDTGKLVSFTTADSLGNFAMAKISIGSYQLVFSATGYKTARQYIELPGSTADLTFKDFKLVIDTNQLATVTVTAQKKLIEKTTSGFIINAAANLTQIGGTATDLLKSAPSVSVDAEGAITLRGKTPLILIDGRNSSLANTDQILAGSVETIEIINTPGARYDANAESGIINIKLKKNKQNGTNGAFVLGTGLGSRGRVNSSILLNHKTGKWNIGVGYDNRFAGRTRKINASRTNFFLPDNYLINQNRHDNRLEQLQNLKLNVDFAPNIKNNISFEAIGASEGQDNNETLNTVIYQQNGIFKSNTTRHSLELERSKVAEFAFEYNRKFNNERRALTASLSTSVNRDRENTDIDSHPFDEAYHPNGDIGLQRTHNYENGNLSNARLDYAIPLSKNGQLQTGYKGTFRSLNADFESADFIDSAYVINTASSNIFNFNEQVHALYASYSSSFSGAENPVWSYHAGIRAEQVFNKGDTKSNSTNFTNSYLKVFPNADLMYTKASGEIWKLSYGKRINRPSSGQLNPFTDITDSLNPHSGNPYLKPEIIHATELNYSKEWKNCSFSAALFYRYATNSIRQYAQLQPNGANLSYPVNIGSASTYGLENVISAKPARFYDFNASLSLFEQRLNGSNISPDAVKNALGWYAKLINNFLPWNGAKLQLTGNFNSSLATPQGKRIALYYADMGFQQKLGKGNARLGVTVTDIFDTLKSGFINNTSEFKSYRYSKADTRAVMVIFAWSFKAAFKEKLLENKFSTEY